ncbi:MAG: cyclomaltodextrinase N-terminal domain-containing protein [Acidobacteriia bacterium]|nr:cyclomaltodextrinase N-terminal domain-containing protein [Terriglobia bacterium]
MNRLALFLIALSFCCMSQPVIDKVEPPHWWVRHTLNPIQVLLTGHDLSGAVVTAPAGITVQVRQASENGHYLFLYVDFSKVGQPRKCTFHVKTASGTAAFDFALLPPEPEAGRFQGFTSDDVIYLVIPDRFANGDAANDALPESGPPADRKNGRYYHGGDFRGIRDHLSYMKDLGVTAVWMLPVFRNSWKGKAPGYYYGYEAADYYDTDPRYGSLQDFIGLVKQAHSMGMKVMQDQVANHCGPGHYWVQDPPTKTWFNGLDRVPKLRNNFEIAALADPYARPKRKELPLLGWFNSELPDLNQNDPMANDYIIQNTLWWIGMSGVDGIRQDTYPYVDRPFWSRWQTAINRQFPKFFVTGEITASTPGVLSFFEGGQVRAGVDTKLTSMLDFPFFNTMRNVFARGQSMKQLTDLLAQDSLYRRPESLVSFFDNHDNQRLLAMAQGDVSRLLMAQTFLLTTRGIPELYYGDEIAMAGRNQSEDFPGGFPGDPVNRFTPEGRTGDSALVFNALHDLLLFRQKNPALRRGSLTNLLVEQDRYAYLRTSPEEYVLVFLNRAGGQKPATIELDDLSIPAGTRFQSWPSGQAMELRAMKLELADPKPIEIYWAPRGPGEAR